MAASSIVSFENLVLAPGQCSIHHFCVLHSAGNNRSGAARVGISFFYLPSYAQPRYANKFGLLVRGSDPEKRWTPDPIPRADFDELCIEHNITLLQNAARHGEDALP